MRKEVVADLYVQMTAQKRREIAAVFQDLLMSTLQEANTNPKISAGTKAGILKDCVLAYKQIGEVMNTALEAEKRTRELLITQDNGMPDLVNTPPGIMEFIPQKSPHLQAPRHLLPLVEALESTLQRERRLVISCPPQHGKSETIKHALIWSMLQKPQSRNAYVSYQSERAETVSTQSQWIADECRLLHQGTRRHWRTRRGGDVIFTGIGGAITGYGFDGLIVVDDPYKGMAEANSPTIRAHVKEWFQSVLMTRVHAGASVIVVQTRWHPDDLAGQLINEGWDHINLEAIDDKNEPLWPEKWPLDLLTRRRVEVGEYVWSALYQGAPRPRGGQVFQTPMQYEVVPEGQRRYWIGVDLAYTRKTYADYSAAVVLCETGDKFYVVDVVRAQEDPPKFRDRINNMKLQYPHAVLAVSCSPTEVGSAYFLEDIGLELSIQKATVDKFLRSQPVAAAWNAGDIVIPQDGWWLQDFKNEVQGFTGVGDTHDDQVDALGAAYNAAKYGSVDWAQIELLQREAPKALELM